MIHAENTVIALHQGYETVGPHDTRLGEGHWPPGPVAEVDFALYG